MTSCMPLPPARRVIASLLVLLPALPFASPARAQQPPPPPVDTLVSLDALVVTADRAQTPLAATSMSVSALTAAQLARMPGVTLADALRMLPGFALVSADGLGYDPQLMVRGFYGGGEAEYVMVLVDGRPINDVQAGLIAWDAVAPAGVARMEVVRGGASALYGDAALAGVINLITSDAVRSGGVVSVAGGSFGTLRGDVSAQTSVAGRAVRVAGGVDRTDGFRDHAARQAWRGSGGIALLDDARGRLKLDVLGHWREFDEPGPLLDTDVQQDRAASDVFFRFDATRDRALRAVLDLDAPVRPATRLTGTVTGERRSTDAVRTLALSPQFADTKQRELSTGRFAGSAQLAFADTPLPFGDRLIAGVDASRSSLESSYYNVVTGPRVVYRNADGARGELDTRGAGDRLAAAAFAHYTLVPVEAVRISLGARADWLRDSFHPETPAGERVSAEHHAISPRGGVNVRYVGGENAGHLYITGGDSFKAPTLDQLFDQRRIPVPFPPFAVAISNAELVPQHGRSVEVGAYQQVALTPAVRAELTLSAYRMRMRDELDFDVATLRYVNIGRSTHRGVEAGVRLSGPLRSETFLNYTLQDVTAQTGEHAGRQLRAIPRTTLSGGITLAPFGSLEAGAFVSHLRDMYIDEANTLALPAYTRVDARVSYALRGVRVFADLRNVLDARYHSTGFPDPAGTGAVYYYPAAGRSVEMGVRTTL